MLMLLSGCMNKRDDYYVLGFGSYSLAVGYDDLEMLRLAFDVECKDTLEAKEELEELEVNFWGRHFGTIDVINRKNKQIGSDKAVVKYLSLYLKDNDFSSYMIDDVVLSESISDNCRNLDGIMVERNGSACVIEKTVHGHNNSIILYGDILNINQDELDHLEVRVQ